MLRLNLNSIINFKSKKDEYIDAGLRVVDKFNKYQERKKYAPGLPVEEFFG